MCRKVLYASAVSVVIVVALLLRWSYEAVVIINHINDAHGVLLSVEHLTAPKAFRVTKRLGNEIVAKEFDCPHAAEGQAIRVAGRNQASGWFFQLKRREGSGADIRFTRAHVVGSLHVRPLCIWGACSFWGLEWMDDLDNHYTYLFDPEEYDAHDRNEGALQMATELRIHLDGTGIPVELERSEEPPHIN